MPPVCGKLTGLSGPVRYDLLAVKRVKIA